MKWKWTQNEWQFPSFSSGFVGFVVVGMNKQGSTNEGVLGRLFLASGLKSSRGGGGRGERLFRSMTVARHERLEQLERS